MSVLNLPRQCDHCGQYHRRLWWISEGRNVFRSDCPVTAEPLRVEYVDLEVTERRRTLRERLLQIVGGGS